MDESKLKKQLIRVTVIVVASSIALCVLVFGVLTYIFRAVHENDHIQMQTEAQEYKSRIIKQIDQNLSILNTLSKACEVTHAMDSPETLKEIIGETNQTNSFITLGYFSLDGQGVLNTRGGDTREKELSSFHNEVQAVVEKAWQGEDAVSNMFDSKAAKQPRFVYSVPVYDQGNIVGALAASDTLSIFEDIVNGDAVMGGQGYVHILGSNGDFLVRSKNTIVKEKMSSIFDGPYLSESMKAEAYDALANQGSMYGDFYYRGEECHFYMEPVGLNGWYLFCVNKIGDSALSFRKVVMIVGATFVLILALTLFLLYYGYYKFRKSTASLLHLAYYDPVTGAKNTLKFDQEFHDFYKEQKDYAVAALNVHNFKAINDLFGRNRGDIVLRYLADVIQKNLKSEEFFCRDSGDLFYILMTDFDEPTIEKRLQEIIVFISKSSLSYSEYSYELSLYAGVAIKGDREKALVAVQSIENTHHRDVAFYNHELHAEVRKKNSIESYMYFALQNKEFKLFLQPKFDLKNDQLIGAEALVRWQNPDGSYRYPNEFIPLFETNGFCVKLDMYMVERVCEQLRKWIDAGITPIPISVNQSKLLFSDRNYPNNLEQILSKYGISPSLITLEILEGVASSDSEYLNQQIEALHQKGFRVSMDDFGSGYSSLNMLFQLKIDELKLDRGFLRKTNEQDDERRQIILEQIIHFANKLDISVVAEGIETQTDRDTMEALSCDYGQGYFYEKPLDAHQFSDKYMN
ncbi:MAG: bifunctional diguanylate cyclase/phosphodiesterase [Massiliimalia sp.]|jgi:diguanylate cyclase (GGDEF)-like protein